MRASDLHAICDRVAEWLDEPGLIAYLGTIRIDVIRALVDGVRERSEPRVSGDPEATDTHMPQQLDFEGEADRVFCGGHDELLDGRHKRGTRAALGGFLNRQQAKVRS